MLSGRRLKAVRRRLAFQQNWKCYWCGEPMNNGPDNPLQVSLDHVVQTCVGGEDRHGNYVAAHRKCNSERQPEFNQRKADAHGLVATTGETPSSPFEVLKGRVT